MNFIGAEATAKSLRKIAQYFDDQELIDRVEEVIAEEMPAVEAAQDEVRPRSEGKTAMLFVGGSRAHHYQDLFDEMGMKTIAAGYEFAHRDDYEGRQVLPDDQGRCRQPQHRGARRRGRSERYKPRKTAGGDGRLWTQKG